MKEGWFTCTIGDICIFNYGSGLSEKKRRSGGIPVYGSNGIIGYHDEALVHEPGIIIGRKGTLGKVFFSKVPFYSIDTTFYITTGKDYHLQFLYYLLRTLGFEKKSTDSAVPGLNRELAYGTPILLPPLSIQHRIAEILGALDDKIECNRRINKTLEKMAMALYKHWFVDFGAFRNGKFVDSELGLIPKGWEVKPIGEVVETLGGGTPNTTASEYWEDGDINWYVPSDLTGAKTLFLSSSSKRITRKGLAESSARLFPAYSVMLTSRATIGEIAINRTEACTNQGFITIIPNEKVSLYQIVFWLKQNMDTIQAKAHGTIFKEITRGTFRNFLIPVAKGVDEYVNKSKAIFNQIEMNIVENETLTRTRDYLLPKLLSGEIEVKAAEKLL